jgi:hypothetical protein
MNPRLVGSGLLASTRSKKIACLCTSEIQTRLCLPKPIGKLFKPTKIEEQSLAKMNFLVALVIIRVVRVASDLTSIASAFVAIILVRRIYRMQAANFYGSITEYH